MQAASLHSSRPGYRAETAGAEQTFPSGSRSLLAGAAGLGGVFFCEEVWGWGAAKGKVADAREFGVESAPYLAHETYTQRSAVPSHTVVDSIGRTPLLELKRLNTNPKARVFVKVEFVNPSGSIKDRVAKHIIETFETQGLLKPGGVIVENSSGNTAAGVAMIAALKGYRAILVVPHKCSQEKVAALRAYGARVVVAPPGVDHSHPHHYENLAKLLEAEIPGAVRLDQYNNQLNVEAHYMTTGPEIWRQTDGTVSHFVCGASTGGTISGVGRYLKDVSGGTVRVVAADPQGSMILPRVKTGQCVKSPGATQIEGIGKDYQVACTHYDVIDDAIFVPDRCAFDTARRMAQEEGIMCGISSGANVYAALELAKSATEPTTIVTVLPDGGSKYFSKIFNPTFLLSHHLITQDQSETMTSTDSVDSINQLIAEFSL